MAATPTTREAAAGQCAQAGLAQAPLPTLLSALPRVSPRRRQEPPSAAAGQGWAGAAPQPRLGHGLSLQEERGASGRGAAAEVRQLPRLSLRFSGQLSFELHF